MAEEDRISELILSNNVDRKFNLEEMENEYIDMNEDNLHTKFRDLSFLKMKRNLLRNRKGIFLQSEQTKNSLDF